MSSLPQPGDIVAGKYVIERKLGEGGMGAVFAARNQRVNKVYALKVMLPESATEEARRRFENEALNAGGLISDHIAQVIDSGSEGALYYMVLELLEGRDLAQIIEETYRAGRRIEPHVAVGWVLQALDGVRVAHAARIVHRDLKPSNLFLARKPDGSEIIKVLDFGISKSLEDSPFGRAVSALTSTKAMLGSPLYVAPEQVRSSKSVDARVDVWAMGVILYELLTGTPPFMGDHLGELFAQIIEQQPTPVCVRSPNVSAQLDAVIMRCLEKRPENRFQTVAELAAALLPFAAPLAASGYGAAPGRVTASGAGGAAPPGFWQTPANAQVPPGIAGFGATTGSGVHPPVVKAGSITQQPSDWQTTTGSPKRRNLAASIAVSASVAIAVLGLVGVATYVRHGKERSTRSLATPGAPEVQPAASLSTVATSTPLAPAASSVASAAPVTAESGAPSAAPTAPPRPAPAPKPAVVAPPPKPTAEPPRPTPAATGKIQDSR